MKASIQRRGATLAAIGRAARLSEATCRGALRYPIPAGNKAIAAFLDKTVHELWPEWYDEDGMRRPEVSSATLRRPASSQNGRAV
ncbi:helix-turn-helix domain-containing protein [Devosia sp.]|uniref:helix-turn-helix domain-containing protein n=1 Tax=Devosia sp. TaxID=1871048 RepID=UPI0037BEABD4